MIFVFTFMERKEIKIYGSLLCAGSALGTLHVRSNLIQSVREVKLFPFYR